jgi:hypothetical protein
LNNVKIEEGGQNYAHKAIIDSILNYSNDTQNTILSSIGYSKDEET